MRSEIGSRTDDRRRPRPDAPGGVGRHVAGVGSLERPDASV